MKIRITAFGVALFALAPFMASNAQATGTLCNDGTTSTAVGKGACSGHGGVKTATKASTTGQTKAGNKATPKADAKTSTKSDTKVAKKPATKTETKSDTKKIAKPAATKTEKTATKKAADASDKDPKDATALCKDGTYSHAKTHTGACSGHGGVDKFLK